MAKRAASTVAAAPRTVLKAAGGLVHAATNPAQTLKETQHAVTGLVRAAGSERRSVMRVLSDYSIGFRLAVLVSLGIVVFAGTALVQTLVYRRRDTAGV